MPAYSLSEGLLWLRTVLIVYQFDTMAVGELVKLVEHVLADYNELLREKEAADALGEIVGYLC